MSCFICDLVAPETHKILDAISSYRGIPLYHVLYDFVSKHFDVKISDDDIVCETCCALLDAMDCFRCKLDDVEHMLQLQIARKYKLCDEKPICRLDDRTAMKYRKGTGKQFACVECSFETDFADCLMPHSWRHEHRADVTKNPTPVNDRSVDKNVCHSCHLGFSADELLETHLLEFHTKDVESGSRNVAASIELELVIDTEGDTDDGNNGEEDIASNEVNENLTDDLQCVKCLGKFNSRRELQQHLRSVHFFCEICNTKCRNGTTLLGHIRRRHTKHICDECGKVLGSLSSYRAHQATHGIDLKFMCSFCNKGFRAKSLLDHHIVIHTKECNFTCHICGQKFIHQRTLRLHIQWHTNPRPHKCLMCDKTYKHISHLAVHRRSHSGELPKACQFCDKRFASASKLKVHMVKHTGVYSHPCQLCSRGYMKRYKLAEHMLSAHGDNTMLANKPKCEYKMMVRPESL